MFIFFWERISQRKIEEITKEFLAIAALENVNITLAEALAANESIATTMVTQISSTAQDLSKGKMTEIDFLNGYIVELGRRYGVATPYNESVHALVKMLEYQIKQRGLVLQHRFVFPKKHQ